MSVPSDAVQMFRDLRADRYVDSITITDLTDRGTLNRATGQYDSETDSIIYSGAALIRPAGAGISDRGEAAEIRHDLDVYLPFDAYGIGPGQELTVTAIHSLGDTDLDGAIATVQWVTDDTYNTHKLIRAKLSEGRGDRG